ncbi:MAG: efflux RND transporter periplasmic adaptor subunit [Xanthobacteraceae bacterium]
MHAIARLASAFAFATLLAACQAQTAPTSRVERPVQIERVSLVDDDAGREFVGVVRARYETDLGFRVAGKIVKRLVNIGDRVHAGDVVAELDPLDLKLQAESAQAELAAATSSLGQASSDAERYATLKSRGFAAIADFDRKQVARDEAAGRLERARRALDIAQHQLGYASLRADADGVITATLAEAGQVVAVGQGVLRLAHRGDKEAVIALPETWLGEARSAAASVRLWSDPDRSFKAHLRELSPQADAATRTYAARFTIEDAGDSVALGMTSTVTLSPGTTAKVARLPLSAVLNRGGGPFVYLVDDSGALVQRNITVASFNEHTAVVTAGVADGDRVVTLGVQKLEAGLRVRTVEVR